MLYTPGSGQVGSGDFLWAFLNYTAVLEWISRLYSSGDKEMLPILAAMWEDKTSMTNSMPKRHQKLTRRNVTGAWTHTLGTIRVFHACSYAYTHTLCGGQSWTSIVFLSHSQPYTYAWVQVPMQAREPLELESQVVEDSLIQILGTEGKSSKAVCALHYCTSSPAPAVLHIREAGDDTEHGDFPHTSCLRYFPHCKQ